MPQPQMQVVGLNRFITTCRRAGAELNEFKDATQRSGSIIASAATGRSPRVSGDLAGSVRPARQARRIVIYAGYARVPYAGPIHWGWATRNISAQPFILEAMRQTESEWSALFNAELQKIVDGIQGA